MQKRQRARRRQSSAPRPRTHLSPRCYSVPQGLRTQPRGPDSALLSPPPLSRGLGVPAARGEGIPERRNPDRETSGQVSHGLYPPALLPAPKNEARTAFPAGRSGF